MKNMEFFVTNHWYSSAGEAEMHLYCEQANRSRSRHCTVVAHSLGYASDYTRVRYS